ncbi:MAG: molybdopterin-dependent oxidoreductase, partial [Polyangiaceae bacterium]
MNKTSDESDAVASVDRESATPLASVAGAEPPAEKHAAKQVHRHESAAGLYSIYETVRRGVTEMGVRRSLRTLLTVNQMDGFDCPSCAWPDPDGERKTAEFCENGAKAVGNEATLARVRPEFFAEHSISKLLEQSDYWLDSQGRITHPMWRRPGSDHYEAITWDAAFSLVGRELKALQSPNEAAFYTSGRASNEAAFLYGLLARQLGTNNLPDCSNLCHESSGLGLGETIGVGKATVKLEDFDHADAIFVIGQNPGTNHPRMLSELQRAARNGCKIVSVNPLNETGMLRFKNPQEPLSLLGSGTPIASLFLPVKINGDVALLKGIMKEMLEEDRRRGGTVLAHDFIVEQTEGFEALRADLEAESWADIVQGSGISRELIREAAQIAIQSERMICSWAMGITQHKNGVANVQSIVNFALLRAQIGRRGAGLCPVRGH